MGGPPSPALLRTQPLRRNFVKGPSVLHKTGLSQRVLSGGRSSPLPTVVNCLESLDEDVHGLWQDGRALGNASGASRCETALTTEASKNGPLTPSGTTTAQTPCR